MKTFTSLLLFAFISITALYSQNDSTMLVIGLEVGSIFNPIENRIGFGRNYSYGLSVEYPKNQFSFGLAGLKKSYGQINVNQFTGDTRMELINGELEEQYAYQIDRLDFNYLALSTRLIYRVPCNCAYVFASTDFEFINRFDQQVTSLYRVGYTSETPTPTIQRSNMKKVNTTVELGFGLKAHFSERFRLNMRFAYGITQIPSLIVNQHFTGKFNYMKINLGFQYALKERK